MKPVIATWSRLLAFSISKEEFLALNGRWLVFGLAATWVAGIGRHWDDPRGQFLQQTGIGSVIYVFCLSLLLWLIAKPLDPSRIRLPHLLTFVSLTSPPAFLYAIPLEKWMDLESSNTINFWFLILVSCWRIALLFQYYRLCGLGMWHTILATALPLGIIVFTLTALNLQHAVFDIMGGIRESEQTPHDAAYGLLSMLSLLAVMLTPLLGLIWISDIVGRSSLARFSQGKAD